VIGRYLALLSNQMEVPAPAVTRIHLHPGVYFVVTVGRSVTCHSHVSARIWEVNFYTDYLYSHLLRLNSSSNIPHTIHHSS
jgi:hypothetical protein